MHKTGIIIVLMTITIAAIAIICFLSPIHQNISYHTFADKRTIASIPNFWNVITNLPFIIVGIFGLTGISKLKNHQLIYSIMFIGILLTGFGSGYYHLHPNNNTLIYDRIPMTIVFTSFLSLSIAECISNKWGRALLFPLVLTGVTSVLCWQHSNDLRFYGFVQCYPMLIVPLIYLLFPSPHKKNSLRIIAWVIAWYAIAKLFEHFDEEVYQLTQLICGHSLKHLFASIATYYLVAKCAKGTQRALR